MKASHYIAAVVLLTSFLPLAALGQDSGSTHAHHDAAAKATITSLKGLHDITANNLMKTAEMLDDELYAYQPLRMFVRPARSWLTSQTLSICSAPLRLVKRTPTR